MIRRCSCCNGTGMMICPRCGGARTFTDGSKCYYCDGTGSVTCKACEGSGKVDE